MVKPHLDLKSDIETHVLPQARIARDVAPVRDSLFAILARRASFAKYRSSPRFARAQRAVPLGTAQTVPLLADTLTMYLADRLPTSMVARLGPIGLARLGRLLESTIKRVGRLLQFVLLPLRWAIRQLRSIFAWQAARRHRKHVESLYMCSAPRDAKLRAMFDGRIVLEGFEADPQCAKLWLRCVKPVFESCQVFVHLYPEQRELLPSARQAHGYLCKDHYPAIEVKNWKSDTCFRDDISFADVAPGYYRIEAGIIDVSSFRRFPLDGSTRHSIDLGWVRIGQGGAI